MTTNAEMSLSPTLPVEHAEFTVDAVVCDMDGTLVDSIAAVEAAWTSVAVELGKDPQEVIEQTHGRRAIDNLRDLKPRLRRLTNEEMEPHVEEFETRILKQADQFSDRVRSRRGSSANSSRRPSNAGSRRSSSNTGAKSGSVFGQMKFGMSKLATPDGSVEAQPSGLDQVNSRLAQLSTADVDEDPFDDDDEEDIDLSGYTEEEIGCPNRSVRILPGVQRLFKSVPPERICVATSGAKTYCHGALYRAKIPRPRVTVTADDPRLKRGKPFPDPFILAAEDLGFDIKKCLVLEDSPSGIKAGVASGAKTIAVCTSHPVEKINDYGAHYIVPSLECVHVFNNPDGTIKVVIDAHPPEHPLHGTPGSFVLYKEQDQVVPQRTQSFAVPAEAVKEQARAAKEEVLKNQTEAPKEQKLAHSQEVAQEKAEAQVA